MLELEALFQGVLELVLGALDLLLNLVMVHHWEELVIDQVCFT